MSKKPAKWIMRHADKCKRAFGLSAWGIYLHIVPDLQVDDSNALGQHRTSYRNITSDIDLNTTLEGDALGHSVITHELLHVAMIERDVAFRRVLDFVPDEHKAHCEALYKDAKEHCTERLARSLTPVLRAVQEK